MRAPALVVLALFCLAVTTACARRAYTVTVTDAPSPRTTQRTQRTEPPNEMRAQAQRLNEAARSRRDGPKAQDRGRDVQVPAPPDIARGTSGLSEQSAASQQSELPPIARATGANRDTTGAIVASREEPVRAPIDAWLAALGILALAGITAAVALRGRFRRRLVN